MPFEKVVITHKFGIISQSHKKQLQERLLERRNQLVNSAKKNLKKDENIINIQITEDFVKEYNEATYEKRIRLDYMCIQMFEKIKKSLTSFNVVDDLKIQLAWAELSQLMQCISPIQEECLDLFIISMQYAHLSILQIPTLFFLAETVIYWIRTDTINQPFLRAVEIKLLKVGQLIFQRIYFYLNEDTNYKQDDLKDHLAIYLQGFDEYENAYSPYPDALLYMRYIIKVGKFITKNVGSKSTNSDLKEEQVLSVDSEEEINNDVRDPEKLFLSEDTFNTSPLINQASIILAILNKKHVEKVVDLALESFIECSTSIARDNWIDSANALYIIGESAKINLKALNCLLLVSNLNSSSANYDLSRSISNSSSDDYNSQVSSTQSYLLNGLETWPWELACIYVDVLTEVCVNGTQAAVKKRALLGFNKNSQDLFKSKQKNLKGFGLLDLTRFRLKVASDQEDWSWKVRYSSIKALVSVCRSLNDGNHEELRQTCWASLVVCQENESDSNVLEAIKVGQISSNTDEFTAFKYSSLKKKISNFRPCNTDENFYFKIARKLHNRTIVKNQETDLSDSSRLCPDKKKLSAAKKPTNQKLNDIQTNSSLYEDYDHKSSRFDNLPIGKLTYVNKSSIGSKEVSSAYPSSRGSYSKADKQVNKRTTLKEEIMINEQFQNKIPDFFSRKNVDLMRIVEDQYRKEEKVKFEEELKKS